MKLTTLRAPLPWRRILTIAPPFVWLILFLLLPFLLGRARTKEWLLLLPGPALLGTFACFWYYEVEFPARYGSAATP